MPQLTLEQIARAVGGEAFGDASRAVRGVRPLDEAGPDDLSLVASPKYAAYIRGTRAGALLVARSVDAELPEDASGVRVDDAHAALPPILARLYPERAPEPGVHPTAVVEEGAEVAPDASVGPHAVVGAGSRVGAGARLGAHVVVGRGCRVGEGTTLHPHAVLYDGAEVGARCVIHAGARIGADGFGFVWKDGAHRKVPQVGGCRIGDEVEIGANSTVDRGSIGDTVVGRGSKVDNLVHVGHNARIGEHVLIVAQVGISGSTRVGDGAVLGGQAGIGGHLTIGAGARVGAQAGVMGDVPAGASVSGYPARPHAEAMRAQGALFRLPRLRDRVRALERAVRGLGGTLDD